MIQVEALFGLQKGWTKWQGHFFRLAVSEIGVLSILAKMKMPIMYDVINFPRLPPPPFQSALFSPLHTSLFHLSAVAIQNIQKHFDIVNLLLCTENLFSSTKFIYFILPSGAQCEKVLEESKTQTISMGKKEKIILKL